MGYRPIPLDILSVLALPLIVGLLHLSLITSTFRVPPILAKLAKNIICVHLEGTALLSSARDGCLSH